MGLNIDENKSKLNIDLQFISNLIKDSYAHFNIKINSNIYIVNLDGIFTWYYLLKKID